MPQDIDSEKPIMQVGQYWFAGEYEGRWKPCVAWPYPLLSTVEPNPNIYYHLLIA